MVSNRFSGISLKKGRRAENLTNRELLVTAAVPFWAAAASSVVLVANVLLQFSLIVRSVLRTLSN